MMALSLAVLPAALPYFGEGLPRTNDVFPHLYRVVALDRLVESGSLWPRWSPDMVHGYGYPVFNFFPSLSHWVVELFHLIGVPVTMAYRLTVLLQAWVAAWGMFFLGRRLVNAAAGWVAALAYVYSPYLLYDSIIRGGLPEAQALALFPFLLLTIWHAAQGQKRWIAAAAFTSCAMLLSHPIVYPIFLFIGVWLLRQAWRQGWRVILGPTIGLGLGILLSAFFLLPALAELPATRALASADQDYSYQGNFLNLTQLVTFPHLPADPALINPPVVRAIPLFVLLWATFRLLIRWRRLSPTTRQQTVDWIILGALSIWLITPSSRFVWETVPLLPQILYPWRFLGLASLAAAMLLALAVSADAQAGWPIKPLLALISLVILLNAIPWLYPPREPINEDPGLADLVAFEAPPLFIGTTTLGEFLPRWVEELPDTAELRQQLLTHDDPDRLSPAPELTVLGRAGRTTDATYALQISQPLTITYRQFYFPGWVATLDGQPLTLQPSRPHGLLEMALPAGEHTLHLFFGTTGWRRLGMGVSLFAAACLGFFLFHKPGVDASAGTSPAKASTPASWSGVAAATDPNLSISQSLNLPPHFYLVITTLLLLTYTFFTQVDTPLRRPTLQPDGILGRPVITPLDYAGEVRLLSYEQSADEIAAAQPIQLTLYWQAQRPIGVTYDVGVQIVDENGLVWSRPNVDRPSDWRFISGNDPWPLDGYRMDPFVLHLLDGTPPGQYFFHVGLVQRETRTTIAAYTLGQFIVTEPNRTAQPLEPSLIPAADDFAAAGLRLLGTQLDRREAQPGDPLRLTLLWQVVDPSVVPADGQIGLELIAADGTLLWQQTTLIAPTYPTAQWQANDRLRTEVLLRLPASLPPGEHIWHVRLSPPNTAIWPIGPLRLKAIDRLWTPPAIALPHNTLLGEVATFLGANVSATQLAPGTPLQVALVWRSEAETSDSYRVFLHLLGPDGQLLTQSDSEPADWSRPTTGWLPGEMIVDERVLFLPDNLAAGEYTLLTGLYLPATGQRLPLPDGQTAIEVTTFVVGE
ncbi:MAG: hypothetical protein IPL78_13905 [Chloroflexi bacterium]|nr:hypothetical protein [Chloroflexota bacterium]